MLGGVKDHGVSLIAGVNCCAGLGLKAQDRPLGLQKAYLHKLSTMACLRSPQGYCTISLTGLWVSPLSPCSLPYLQQRSRRTAMRFFPTEPVAPRGNTAALFKAALLTPSNWCCQGLTALLPLCLAGLFPRPRTQASADAEEARRAMPTLGWRCSLGRWNPLQIEESRLANTLLGPQSWESLSPGRQAPESVLCPSSGRLPRVEGNEMVLSRGGPEDDKNVSGS